MLAVVHWIHGRLTDAHSAGVLPFLKNESCLSAREARSANRLLINLILKTPIADTSAKTELRDFVREEDSRNDDESRVALDAVYSLSKHA
jgi:hypothetical protein